MRNRERRWSVLSRSAVFVGSAFLLFGSVHCRSSAPPPQAELPPVITFPAPAPTPIVKLPRPAREIEKQALTVELQRLWTRDADRLVEVVELAFRSSPDPLPLTFLLAIAHAETNGKILDVSEAGAVGLAQATPTAYLSENFSGRLFVTRDYVEGTRAYLQKKPLHDVDAIATLVLQNGDNALPRARQLLAAAYELRLEAIAELDYLHSYAAEDFAEQVARANDHNLRMIEKLERLLDERDYRKLEAHRDQARAEYRALKQKQAKYWRRYQLDLASRRDQLLHDRYGIDADVVKKTIPYEAGEYLATVLDDRFSPSHMACFLSQHLMTKRSQARELPGIRNVEAWTAALYNGGSHNVRRMLAGLITGLAETENYMTKVPTTRRRLDSIIEQLPADPVQTAALQRGTF